MIYLTLPELLHIAGRVLGPDYAVRDYGLLEAALAVLSGDVGQPGDGR
jgi:death-on-curing protein